MIDTYNGTATLSSNAGITTFSYADQTIRFRTSPRLECYVKVKQWDNGYIVVIAKYAGVGETEEYIDLVPILNNLYINPDDFLKHIKNVRIDYEQQY